jgi:hypothetical protein
LDFRIAFIDFSKVEERIRKRVNWNLKLSIYSRIEDKNPGSCCSGLTKKSFMDKK